MSMPYRILSHIADLKIKATGKNLPDVFINAALAIASQQSPEAKKNEDEPWQEILLQSFDLPSLLVDWLNEILYQSEASQRVYLDFEILEFSKEPPSIKAKIRGPRVPTKNIEIKAATYHELEIKKAKDGWEAVVVLDI